MMIIFRKIKINKENFNKKNKINLTNNKAKTMILNSN